MERDEQLIALTDALTQAITDLDLAGLLSAAAPATWRQACVCLQSGEAAEQLLGYRLVLTALVVTPDAPRLLVERLGLALAGRL